MQLIFILTYYCCDENPWLISLYLCTYLVFRKIMLGEKVLNLTVEKVGAVKFETRKRNNTGCRLEFSSIWMLIRMQAKENVAEFHWLNDHSFNLFLHIKSSFCNSNGEEAWPAPLNMPDYSFSCISAFLQKISGTIMYLTNCIM